MKKQKLRNIIALSLFCFYVFYAVISLTYKPPKHNYSKEDLRKIKEQQEKKQKSQKQISKQQTSTNRQEEDQKLKPDDQKQEQQLVEIRGLEEFDDLPIWDELDQFDQIIPYQKEKQLIKGNNLWISFFWIEYETMNSIPSQTQQYTLEAIETGELSENIAFLNEQEVLMAVSGNMEQKDNHCFTYQFFYYDYEVIQNTQNSAYLIDQNMFLITNSIHQSQNNLWRMYFWYDYKDNVFEILYKEHQQLEKQDQAQNLNSNKIWKRYFRSDVLGDDYYEIKSSLIEDCSNTLVEDEYKSENAGQITQNDYQYIAEKKQNDTKWKRYFVLEFEGDETFIQIQDSLSDEQNKEQQESENIDQEYISQTANSKVIQSQFVDQEQSSEQNLRINHNNLTEQVSYNTTEPQIQIQTNERLNASNVNFTINAIISFIGFLLFNLLAFCILNEKFDKETLVKNKEIQTDHDSLVELNYLFQDFLIHQRLFNEKILVSQGMIEQCVKQLM